MNIFVLVPLVKVGKILFSAERSEVRQVLARCPTEFKKASFSANTSDDFGDFHVFYDKNNTVEAIEFFGNECQVTYNQTIIFPVRFEEFKLFISSIDSETVFKNDGCVSQKLGISAYVPELPVNQDAELASLLIFRKGYYD